MRPAAGPNAASGSASGVATVSSAPTTPRSARCEAVNSASSYSGSVQLTPAGPTNASR